MSKKFFLALFSVFALVNVACAQTIEVYCPTTQQITAQPETSPYHYSYHAVMPIALPQLSNQLSFIGQGNSAKALQMTGAEYTDGMLTCVYLGDTDTMVLASDEIRPYVNRCYFQGTGAGCKGSDPKMCPLICEVE